MRSAPWKIWISFAALSAMASSAWANLDQQNTKTGKVGFHEKRSGTLSYRKADRALEHIMQVCQNTKSDGVSLQPKSQRICRDQDAQIFCTKMTNYLVLMNRMDELSKREFSFKDGKLTVSEKTLKPWHEHESAQEFIKKKDWNTAAKTVALSARVESKKQAKHVVNKVVDNLRAWKALSERYQMKAAAQNDDNMKRCFFTTGKAATEALNSLNHQIKLKEEAVETSDREIVKKLDRKAAMQSAHNDPELAAATDKAAQANAEFAKDYLLTKDAPGISRSRQIETAKKGILAQRLFIEEMRLKHSRDIQVRMPDGSVDTIPMVDDSVMTSIDEMERNLDKIEFGSQKGRGLQSLFGQREKSNLSGIMQEQFGQDEYVGVAPTRTKFWDKYASGEYQLSVAEMQKLAPEIEYIEKITQNSSNDIMKGAAINFRDKSKTPILNGYFDSEGMLNWTKLEPMLHKQAAGIEAALEGNEEKKTIATNLSNSGQAFWSNDHQIKDRHPYETAFLEALEHQPLGITAVPLMDPHVIPEMGEAPPTYRAPLPDRKPNREQRKEYSVPSQPSHIASSPQIVLPGNKRDAVQAIREERTALGYPLHTWSSDFGKHYQPESTGNIASAVKETNIDVWGPEEIQLDEPPKDPANLKEYIEKQMRKADYEVSRKRYRSAEAELTRLETTFQKPRSANEQLSRRESNEYLRRMSELRAEMAELKETMYNSRSRTAPSYNPSKNNVITTIRPTPAPAPIPAVRTKTIPLPPSMWQEARTIAIQKERNRPRKNTTINTTRTRKPKQTFSSCFWETSDPDCHNSGSSSLRKYVDEKNQGKNNKKAY